MPIPMTCECGAALSVSDQAAGRWVKCPKCATQIFVPVRKPDPPRPAAEPEPAPASRPAPATSWGVRPGDQGRKILRDGEGQIWPLRVTLTLALLLAVTMTPDLIAPLGAFIAGLAIISVRLSTTNRLLAATLARLEADDDPLPATH